MSLIVKNALLDGKRVDVHVREGRIHAIGTDLEALDGERLEGGGKVLVPGLVNGHTHAAMTLLRGYGDDMALMAWLQTRIWPAEARMTEEDVYWGVRLACLEMIRSGTILFQDGYWHFHAVARAVQDAGLRARVGAAVIDVRGPEQRKECQRLADKHIAEISAYSDRLELVVTPHSIYTVSEEALRWVAEFSEKHTAPAQIHLSEAAHEVEECLTNHRCRPAFYLDRCGLLNERTFLAHGVHLDDDELDLIAERGASIVTNPVSNMKLAVGGVFPFTRAHQRGIPLALGTDGAASNNALDLFQEMKFLALLQKHADGDPTVLPAQLVWETAVGKLAPSLGQPGEIEVGGRADFLLLDMEAPEVIPSSRDLHSNLVYAATGQVVDSTVVDGKVLMKHRVVDGEEEVRAEATERARRVRALG